MIRKIQFGLAGIFFTLATMAGLAQEKAVNVGQVYLMTPKPGMIKQFEDGRKRHMEFHRKHNDTWSWETYQITTGEQTGDYLSVTFGHTWKDIDTWEAKLGDADLADGDVNMTPYLANTTSSVWMYMADVSRSTTGDTPDKMLEVQHYMLKPGASDDFQYIIGKIHAAIGKESWPVHYRWYSLMNGGQGPHYVLVIPHDNWADMAGPDLGFDAMLEKALGKHEAEALTHDLFKTIAHEWTEMLVYRPDLSYVAPK